MKQFKPEERRMNVLDKAATSIAHGLLKTQNGFAVRLQQVTKNWKQKQQWIFLYMVCLVSGGLSTLALVHAFRYADDAKPVIPKPISIPRNIPRENNAFLITTNEFQQVQEYKKAHPDVIKDRPGLSDSLALIEEVYYSQKKQYK